MRPNCLLAVKVPNKENQNRSRQRGAAIAEMALVLPVFFLLCWGFILLAFILFGYCSSTYAAKVAVRYAAVHGSSSPSPCTSTQLTTMAKQYLWGVPVSGTTVAPSWPTGNTNIGSLATVTITVVYPTGIPFSTLHSVTIGTTATETILE